MMGLSPWLALICATLVAGLPPRDHAYKVKESVNPPSGWSRVGPAPANHVVQLRIALPQPKFSLLEEHLYQISDPTHDRYGEHLTKEEVEALVAPDSESIHLVNEWLASHGIHESDLSRSPAKDWVVIKAPVSLAEQMLKTEYSLWAHAESGDVLVRTTEYWLPEFLAEHIEFAQPTTLFARPSAMRSTPTLEPVSSGSDSFRSGVQNEPPIKVPSAHGGQVDAVCNTTITPKCLKQLYNAVDFKPSGTNGNEIGITGYLEQWANVAELQTFYRDHVPEAVNSSFKTVLVKGGINTQNTSLAGVEAALDVQYAFGLTYPTPGTYWSVGGRGPFIPDAAFPGPESTNEPYADWLDFILKQKKIPQVISTSYGEPEHTIPYTYAQRVCRQFAQLGARGVSVLFSSGDFGVGDGEADPANQKCLSNDGRNVTQFLPFFPASCPYVTAVGGTVDIPETAVFFSGGGFSDYFPRPFYQTKAVNKFLKKLPQGTYKGLYNPKGRGFPDVSAQALRYLIYLQGAYHKIGGTSASSPAVAGLITLLNSARIRKRLPPLGFLNPLLYAIQERAPAAFNDITTGNNPGCGTPGFNATAGWDPVTGLGTLNLQVLKDLVIGGPFERFSA